MTRRCSSGKKVYRDEIAVKIAFAQRAEQEIRYYKCNRCPGWHLTSQPQRTIPRGG